MMKKFLIRFNTKHGESDFYWRIFENGIEKLAKSLEINVPTKSESSMEGAVVKWNIVCLGYSHWLEDHVIIDDKDN